MSLPSVTPTSRQVHQYVRQRKCLTVIPQAGPVHPYVSHVSCLSVITSYKQVCLYVSPVTRLSAIPLVCLSSVTSVLPSANPTVKMPTSIPVRNFPYYHFLGKIPFVHTSTELSVHHQDSPSVNSSPFAAKPLKLPSNYGENSTVNYLHENPVKSPTVSTSYDMSVVAPVHASYVPFICALFIRPIHKSCVMSDVAPVCASSIPPVHTSCITSVFAPVCAPSVPSVLPYDDKHQEFPDGFPSTHYGEKNPSEITAKIPHDVTLTLQQAKFPEETPDTTKRVKYPGNFMLT